MTLREVGARLGISFARVKQIESRALERLKNNPFMASLFFYGIYSRLRLFTYEFCYFKESFIMARKSLLTESEIRRFMKLASMQPVGADRMQSLHEQGEELEMGMGAEEAPMGDLPPESEEEEVVTDMDEVPEEEEEVDPEMEAKFVDVVQAVADVLGVEVDVEGGEEELAPPEEELEMGAELEEPLPGGGEEELAVSDEEELPGLRTYQEQQERIVNEVARRVALRLTKETQREQMADQLAERILKRLTK